MAAETAMGASFRKSGVVPLKVELRVALSRFHNLGLSFNDMRAELDDLERMSGMGQSNCASNGPNRPAQTRQQVEGGAGQIFNSRKGHDLVASPPSSNHDERGQTRIASSGQTVAASSRRVPDRGGEGQVHSVPAHQTVRALPVREPTPQQRSISARNASAVATKLSVFDSHKIDNRPIGNYTVSEARSLGRLKTKQGYILMTASRMVANAIGHELLRSVVKENEMEKIIQKSAEVEDAA